MAQRGIAAAWHPRAPASRPSGVAPRGAALPVRQRDRSRRGDRRSGERRRSRRPYVRQPHAVRSRLVNQLDTWLNVRSRARLRMSCSARVSSRSSGRECLPRYRGSFAGSVGTTCCLGGGRRHRDGRSWERGGCGRAGVDQFSGGPGDDTVNRRDWQTGEWLRAGRGNDRCRNDRVDVPVSCEMIEQDL